MGQKPSVLVTGVSGEMGLRLAGHLTDFEVLGVDLHQPAGPAPLAHFEELDLAEERSCDLLLGLMRRFRPEAVVHLAWGNAPFQPSPAERKRAWQANVAGTGRVLEAIAEHNRRLGGLNKFIYPSTFWVYGPNSNAAAREDSELNAAGFYQVTDRLETDVTIQTRSRALGSCRTYILRAAIHAGDVSVNHLLTLLSGVPDGAGWRANRARRKHALLPILLPRGQEVLAQRYQFIHCDDLVRLIAFLLRRTTSDPKLNILNVAALGDPLSLERIVEVAGARLKRLPMAWLRRMALKFQCSTGLSQVPFEAYLFGSGSYVMDTSRLRAFLGENFGDIIRHGSEEALRSNLSHTFEELPMAAN